MRANWPEMQRSAPTAETAVGRELFMKINQIFPGLVALLLIGVFAFESVFTERAKFFLLAIFSIMAFATIRVVKTRTANYSGHPSSSGFQLRGTYCGQDGGIGAKMFSICRGVILFPLLSAIGPAKADRYLLLNFLRISAESQAFLQKLTKATKETNCQGEEFLNRRGPERTEKEILSFSLLASVTSSFISLCGQLRQPCSRNGNQPFMGS
jgi:hypothetical protein